MSYWSCMNYKLMSPPPFHVYTNIVPKNHWIVGKFFESGFLWEFCFILFYRISAFDCIKKLSKKKTFFSFDCFNAHCLFIIWECASLVFFRMIFFLASAFWNSIVDLEMIVHCSPHRFKLSSISTLIHYRFICKRGFPSTHLKINIINMGEHLKLLIF